MCNRFPVGTRVRMANIQKNQFGWASAHIGQEFTVTGSVAFYQVMLDRVRVCDIDRLELATRPYTVDQWSID